MTAKFRINDLLHHRQTNEDGRVNRVYEEDGVTVYEVAVPMDPTSWMLGASETHWREDEVEISRNESLRRQ